MIRGLDSPYMIEFRPSATDTLDYDNRTTNEAATLNMQPQQVTTSFQSFCRRCR